MISTQMRLTEDSLSCASALVLHHIAYVTLVHADIRYLEGSKISRVMAHPQLLQCSHSGLIVFAETSQTD